MAGLGVLIIVLLVLGLIGGAVGQALFGKNPALSWLNVPTPKVELASEPVFHVGGFTVTNTLMGAWLTTIVLLAIALTIRFRLKLVPGRFQALMEFGMEALLNFIESIAGHKYGRKFFPMVATIFLFVIMNAYLGLLPFFGAIGPIDSHGVVEYGLFRAANTDVNVPLAIAICAFVFIEYWGIRAMGAWHYISEFINVKQLGQGLKELFTGKVRPAVMNIVFGIVNLFVGLIELLSHFIRLVSFTFRLFGNMTAGEILIVMIAFLVPLVVGIPFYGLELLVGVIQALIFAGLTLVFATIAVGAGAEEHEH